MRATRKGNTIPEYVLVGLGGCIVCITALQLLGGNLDGLFGQFKSKLNPLASGS